MKKLMGLLILAASIPWVASTSAAAPVPNVTNTVQQVNFLLTFTSQLATNTSHLTNITHTGTGKNTVAHTNITTNVVYTVSKKSIGTKDVISSLLGSNAPVGATLVRVQNDGNTTYEVRIGKTRVFVGNLRSHEVDSVLAKGTKYKDGVLVPGSGTDYSLREYALLLSKGSPLSFKVIGATDVIYGKVSLGKFSTTVNALTASVVGGGTDAIGLHELVTGTITVNGAALKVEQLLMP
ncbi:MAG TPA: hypothetical protein VGO59_11975 [Verrucomicrobiae bacterium]